MRSYDSSCCSIEEGDWLYGWKAAGTPRGIRSYYIFTKGSLFANLVRELKLVSAFTAASL